jgi:glucokinase
LAAYLNSPEGTGASAIGISFAGPITRDGIVIAAPTIWGSWAPPLRLGEILEQRLGLPVVVANDITAAAWRYASTEPEPFCLFTISSGIGNKVFRHGEVVVDDDGFGGELGHWRIDQSADAMKCDCGGRGHLGAVASGRGMVAAVRRAAACQPLSFGRSYLSELASSRPEYITSPMLVAAVQHDDEFAIDVLRGSLRPLASAVACMFAAIGVRRYLFIGGFALAIGQPFVTLLGDELVQLGCFGLNEEQTRGMLRLGLADDDHSLVGMGRLLASTVPSHKLNPGKLV